MKLPEDAGVEQAPELAAKLPKSLAEATGTWRIDASALKAFDSSTIALLLHARRLARKEGREIEIVGVPAQLSQLAKLYGIDSLLELPAESVESAAELPAA